MPEPEVVPEPDIAELDFFARMGLEFTEHVVSARENAARQAEVERLVAKAEYEYGKLRRELAGLLPIAAEADAIEADAAPRPADVAPPLTEAA
ncbi:MAG TPA: hypothetical protein VH852_04335 [Hyphomicrobium sp.]